MESVWITCGKVQNIRLCTIFYAEFKEMWVHFRVFRKISGGYFIVFLSENHEKSHQYKVFENTMWKTRQK